MSTSQRAMTPSGWGVKAGMVRVWVASKLCGPPPCYTRAISKRFRDKELYITKHYINSPFSPRSYCSRGARMIFLQGVHKPGTIIAPVFFCYVWMPCCIPDPTLIEKVDFRLRYYMT